MVGVDGWALPNWVQGYEAYWTKIRDRATADGDGTQTAAAGEHVTHAKEFGELLRGVTQQYQVAYVELDKDLGVDKICDIFTQINTRGIRLDVFDLVNALLKPKGLQLKHMWRKAAKRLEFASSDKMNVYILQVMSILRQNYCSPKYLYYLLPGQAKQIRDSSGNLIPEILIPDIGEFTKRWDAAVAAMEEAIKLLRHPHEFGVISSQYLPYVSILPVFASLQTRCRLLPAERRLDAQKKIRHWYWASVFLNRYSGSVESTSARDYLDVVAWFDNNDAEPPPIQEFKARFKSLDLRKETKRGSSVYNGLFNLIVIKGAKDWISGNVPQPDRLDDHHIVPASWDMQGLDSNLIHSILNRTPLSADTNRNVIGEQLPNKYLANMIAHNGEDAVRNILDSHFISAKAQAILLRDPFTLDDFHAFISERQQTIQKAIEDLLIKERFDLSPDLRELDEKIEHVELRLRSTIESTIGPSIQGLPLHITQRAIERIEAAAKKNAAFDSQVAETVSGILQFCDVRDLQDVITSRITWPTFEVRFKNKDTLAVKFTQFAELRNSIRHSRTVDQITRKEGEAALLWFDQVMSK